MRKLSLFIITLVSIFAIISCEKDETKTVLSSNPGTPAFTNLTAGANIVFLKENANNSVDFIWSAADFGFKAAVTYSLQMDKQGSGFAEAITLGTTVNVLNLSLKLSEFNNTLLALKGNPEDETPLALEFRVKASVTTLADPVYSASVLQNITTYYIPVVYPRLFVPGSYQGWAPSDSSTSIFSVKANGLYEGYIWFNIDNAMFKYTEGPNWDNNWGDNGNDGSLEKNGSDIPAGLAGYYKLNVDLNAKTHTFLRTDWGLIGSATPGGWDSDQNMTYDVGTKVWTITLNLVAGEIKFRANDAWDLNYGDNKAPNPNGILDAGGDNIAIAEDGNYTITLDLGKAVYKYKVVKN
jgi:hypothetical protein